MINIKLLFLSYLSLLSTQAWCAYLLAPAVFKVRSISGVVLVRRFSDTNWRRVSLRDKLLEGQLIQVTQGAKITLEHKNNKKSEINRSDDLIQINLTQPIVARLSPNIIRPVTVNNLFVENTPYLPLKNITNIQKSSFILEDAWKRLTAVITKREANPSQNVGLMEQEKQGLSAGFSKKKLNLITPSANTILRSDQWPADVRIVWLKPNQEKLRFQIYVWPVNKERQNPRAETTNDYYMAQIPIEGKYYIQVTDSRGSWESAPQVLYATRPIPSSRNNGITSHNDTIYTKESLLLFPPDQFILFSPQPRKVPITLTWDFGADIRDRSFQLHLFNQERGDTKKYTTKSNEISVFVEPGNYTWYVESDKRSTTRRFSVIERKSESNQYLSLLSRLVKTKKDAMIFLEDGL